MHNTTSLLTGQQRSPQNTDRKHITTNAQKRGPTGTRTRIAGFKDQSANHYTIRPIDQARHSSFLTLPETQAAQTTKRTKHTHTRPLPRRSFECPRFDSKCISEALPQLYLYNLSSRTALTDIMLECVAVRQPVASAILHRTRAWHKPNSLTVTRTNACV